LALYAGEKTGIHDGLILKLAGKFPWLRGRARLVYIKANGDVWHVPLLNQRLVMSKNGF